jgi:ribosomal protein S18 acetylase RimI-like enzyme
MVHLLVTYMEQLEPPAGSGFPSPIERVSIEQERLEPEDYLSLYRAVGEPLQWDQRLRMPLTELEIFLRSPSTDLYVLRNQNRAIGLCEFDGAGNPDVELTNFGLVPEAQGNRLGPFLLDSALRAVWSREPRRIWLHTDTYDHPKAKTTYERAGFRVYAEKIEEIAD